MNCTTCNQITGHGCEESFCNGSVSLPCDFVIPAACVKNVTALPNLGACNEIVSDYACTDLQTVLLAIDAQLENCGVDTFVESGALDGGTLTLTLNDETEVEIDLSALVNATQFWARNTGSGFLYPTTLNDSVGIGTITPDYKLEVEGDFFTTFVPNANQESFIINGERTFTLPYTGAATIEGGIVGYLTSTSSSLLISLPTAISFNYQTSSVLTEISASASLGASLACETGTDIRSSVTASASNNAAMRSQTASDSTVLLVNPTQLTIDGNVGFTGTFTTGTGDTVTVRKGIITSVAP